MSAAAYPSGSNGYPASNYLLADEASRPRFELGHDIPGHTGSDPTLVIIGAGFTGLSAALHVAEARRSSGLAARIVLLDQGRVACGPSGKSGGHICGLQPPDKAVSRACGPVLGQQLIAAAVGASQVVRSLIERHGISCDLRDGYVLIQADGSQITTEGGNEFGIDPYPFAIGLAQAASRLGVEIREGVGVSGLRGTPTGCLVSTSEGPIEASFVLACGGHRMAETIALLSPLRRVTTELRVSTVITDPVPGSVLRAVMPSAQGRRFPFADVSADVAYGSIDRSNRVIFGAGATALSDPLPDRIMRTLSRLLPSLLPAYRKATGKDLAWRPLVRAERLSFTRNYLPNVGSVEGHRNILFVNGLGGHGIAIGTLLGRAAAEKLWGMRVGGSMPATVFDAFAAVPHGWLPAWQPWRGLAAGFGLFVRRSRPFLSGPARA